MLPDNTVTRTTNINAFLPPNDEQYYPLKQIVLGGKAINDISLGLEYQKYSVYYVKDTIRVSNASGLIVFSLLMPNVTTVSLAFDSSMRVILAWTTLVNAGIHYYNTNTNEYVTNIFSNITSCRVSLDCNKSFYSGLEDVIFAYTLNNKLYFRQQRDNYSVEMLLGDSGDNLLITLGLDVENRLQFRLASPSDLIGEVKVINVPFSLGRFINLRTTEDGTIRTLENGIPRELNVGFKTIDFRTTENGIIRTLENGIPRELNSGFRVTENGIIRTLENGIPREIN